MSEVKFMVLYPRPKDIETFERRYQEEHVPMAMDKLVGKTQFVATKLLATPTGTPPSFYRIAEVYFPSMEALQSCAESEGGKQTFAHAVEISTGGDPLFLIAEEQSFNFETPSFVSRLKSFSFG